MFKPFHFLFPAHPLEPSTADELFREQKAAFEDASFSTSLLHDAVLNEGMPLRRIPAGNKIVYRGWMLNACEYVRLAETIRAAGAAPLTTPEQYLAAHHLPNWYPLIAELTPETRIYPADADLVGELRTLGWPSFFIKDHVKSLKTSLGSIIDDPAKITALVEEMTEFRGEIEGGICVRRVEDFAPETERRYFVLNGCPFAADAHQSIPDVVHICTERISIPFFSVDVVQRRDGIFRVVEIGDGQVSDLVGWTASRFVQLWSGESPG